ncbi:MAG: succinyl-diaminopimelate desuccinylase [Alphaproteobacteria bacterium]
MPTYFSNPVAHAQALIKCPSVTPEQAGSLDYLETVLSQAGFRCQRLPYESATSPRVDNLYARIGSGSPHLCFAGHVDVVPPGEETDWTYPPFDAHIVDGVLYGRGAVDMKGGVAAMLSAAMRYLEANNAGFNGSISFLITGDEEGPGVNGTCKVVDWMRENGEQPDHCLLGEPTSLTLFGDTIKNGRRGSLNGQLTVIGEQGHVAYPHLAKNPLTGLIAVLKRLLDEVLDDGSANFAPSNFEVTSIDTGNPTTNVIPAKVSARFNIRFNDLHTGASLSDRIATLADTMLHPTGLMHELDIDVSSDSFLTQPGGWVDKLMKAIGDVTCLTPKLSTSGGTSDARFINKLCPVVEFGLLNKTIHKVDEQVPVAHLHELTDIFHNFMRRYFP